MGSSGTYDLNLSTPLGTQQGTLVLRAAGEGCEGTLTNARGSSRFTDGVCTGDTITFDTKIPTPLGRLRAHVQLTVDGDHISGTAKLPLGVATIEGRRTDGEPA